MAELFEAIPKTVLAVYAHPDDADVACGGALARWRRQGSEVYVVLAAEGDKGTPDPALPPEELVARRAGEVQRAAAALGLDPPARLGYADGEVGDDPGLRARLVEWIRRIRPDVVLTHDPTAVFFGEDYYNHRDHRSLGFAVLDASSPAAALPHYFPAAGPPHQVKQVLLSGTLQPSVWVDIEDDVAAKVAAVACHASQFADGGSWVIQAVRRRAEEEGRRAGLTLAEGFRRLRLGG